LDTRLKEVLAFVEASVKFTFFNKQHIAVASIDVANPIAMAFPRDAPAIQAETIPIPIIARSIMRMENLGNNMG
jgi:hypothetical protein